MKITMKSPYGMYRILQEEQRDGQVVFAIESRGYGFWGWLWGWVREEDRISSHEKAIISMHILIAKDKRRFAKETVHSKRIPAEI